MRFELVRRRSHRRPSRWWLLALLPLLFLLTTPMPLPRSVIAALRDEAADAASFSRVPTARIALRSATSGAAVASATPVVAVAALPSAEALPTQGAILPPTELPAPTLTVAPPTTTPMPPTETLPPPLLIITSPPAPPTVPPTIELPAALPTLMPTLPAAPPVASVAGPVAPPGQPLHIPTLMYHYVRFVDGSVDPLGFNLSVSPPRFEEQLDWLVQAGYTTVTMNTLMRCIHGGTVEQPCPAKPVALTFDDGYEDAFTAVLPALQKRGMVATFYVIGNSVGHPAYMNWDQVRALQAAGMEIGAHSMNHPDLTTLGWDQARAEIAESKALVEANIGQPIGSFCYPAGRFTSDTVALVQEAGFTNATTTMPDLPQSNPFLLPRIRIEGSHELGTFQWLVP